MATSSFSCFLILVLVSITGVISSIDKRCEKHVCNLNAKPLANHVTDPTTIGPGSAYAKCLVGPEWDAKLAELGQGKAKRTFTPTLQFDNWLSAEISQNIFRMLAEETMGFPVEPFAGPSLSGFDILCCENKHHIMLEKWPTMLMPDDTTHFSLTEIPIGYEGGSGLYVPSHTVHAHPLATSYNAYKYLPEYANIFPKGYTTPCIEATRNKTLGCQEGNYVCNSETWPNTTCASVGRYVPPQCEAAPSECQEIFMGDPNWDMGFFESLIKNTGLKFVLVYLGNGEMSKVMAEQTAKRDFIFYWFEPDPLITLVGAESVAFKTPSFSCRSKENNDPTLSGGDCDYGKNLLQKVARRDSLLLDADFKFFFEAFQLSSTDVSNMLSQHTSGGGTSSSYNISCNWLKNNYGTWKDWVRNTPTETANSTTSSASDEKSLVVVIVVSPILAILLVGGATGLWHHLRSQKAVKHAPTKPPLAVVFTDIESSTRLWEAYGNDMAAAVDMHHKIIRECIEENHCYEVKVVGDAFMFVSESLVDATSCCLAIQSRLMDADWPEVIMYCDPSSLASSPRGSSTKKAFLSSSGGDTSLFRGLRVRMGVHYCTDVDAKFDVVHGRYDYYGPDVNIASRVQSAAAGGQLLMTQDTFTALRQTSDFADVIGDDAKIIKCSSAFELKGVSEPVVLFSMLPEQLAGRYFEPLDGGGEASDGEVTRSISEMSAENVSANGSEQNSSTAFDKHTLRVVRHIFSLYTNRKEKETFMSVLLEKKGLTPSLPSGGSVSFSRKLRLLATSISSATQPTAGRNDDISGDVVGCDDSCSGGANRSLTSASHAYGYVSGCGVPSVAPGCGKLIVSTTDDPCGGSATSYSQNEYHQ